MWAGAKVCVTVRACACIGGCVGAEERRGSKLKEGEERLTGNGDMAGDSCEWEEQYGGRSLLRYTDGFQISRQPVMV